MKLVILTLSWLAQTFVQRDRVDASGLVSSLCWQSCPAVGRYCRQAQTCRLGVTAGVVCQRQMALEGSKCFKSEFLLLAFYDH